MHGQQGVVGKDSPGLGLPDNAERVIPPQLREEVGLASSVDAFVVDPLGSECTLDVVDESAAPQQPPTQSQGASGVLLEAVPEGVVPPGESHLIACGVRQTVDPRGAAGAADRVAHPEPVEHDDVVPSRGQLGSGGKTHDASTDDDDSHGASLWGSGAYDHARLPTKPIAATACEDAGMADVFVRPARLIDAAGFAAVQRRSWSAAATDLTLPPPPEASEMERSWEKAVMAPPSDRHSTWVAIETSSGSESVVGAAALAPASDPDLSSETCLELVVFTVDPDHRGKGHGSRLLAASMQTAADAREQEAVAWVAAGDDALRRFLEESGWAADGAHRTLSTDDPAVADHEGQAPEPVAQLRQVRLGTLLQSPAP